MAALQNTSNEGSDDLKEFLDKWESKLKETRDIYDRLSKMDIDLSELLEFEESDLRTTLEGHLKPIQITRLFIVLKQTPESAIYKQKQKPKILILLSNKEQNIVKYVKQCLNNVKQSTINVKQAINSIDTIALEKENVINEKFDEIIKMVNQHRNKLLKQLQTDFVDKNTARLNEKLEKLDEMNNNIKECNSSIESIIHNSGNTGNGLDLNIGDKREQEIIGVLKDKLGINDNEIGKIEQSGKCSIDVKLKAIDDVAQNVNTVQVKMNTRLVKKQLNKLGVVIENADNQLDDEKESNNGNLGQYQDLLCYHCGNNVKGKMIICINGKDPKSRSDQYCRNGFTAACPSHECDIGKESEKHFQSRA